LVLEEAEEEVEEVGAGGEGLVVPGGLVREVLRLTVFVLTAAR